MSARDFVAFAAAASRVAPVARRSERRVRRLQSRRLIRLVRHAAARSPYYRRKFSGIDLGAFALGDLPITTKPELNAELEDVFTVPGLSRRDLEDFVADPANLGQWFRGKWAVSHTSGSQGAPIFIVQDRKALAVLFATMSARANAGRSLNLGEAALRFLRPKRIAVLSAERGFFPSAAAFEFMPRFLNRFVDQRWFAATDWSLIEQLNAFQPDVLVGYAGVLDALAVRPHGLRLHRLRSIANSSEQLAPAARKRIEAAFRAPVLDHYGMGECLHLADGCRRGGGAHVNADWVIIENVDDDYRPVRAGELGTRILVTNLANFTQPFIRYEVADRIAFATDDCGCGNRLPRIERIEGRSADAFWLSAADREVIVTGALFHNAIDQVGGIREWQALQIDAEEVRLRVELLPDAEPRLAGFNDRLRDKLTQLGLPTETRLELVVVPEIAADPASRKVKRMVTLPRGPENSARLLSVTPACY